MSTFENLKLYKLFPTLLMHFQSFLSESDCDKIFEFCKTKETALHHDVTKGSVTSFDFAVRDHKKGILYMIDKELPGFSGIYEHFEKTINLYAEECGIEKLKISNNWFNFQTVGSLLKNHTHPMTAVTSVLFINVDENSSPIYFDNPKNVHSIIKTVNTEYNCEMFKLIPKKGDLVVFPGDLYHGSGYEENRTPDRTIISINAQYVVL